MPAAGPERELLVERAATLERLTVLAHDLVAHDAATAGSNADDEHDPEGVTLAVERARAAGRLADARAHLAEVDEALVRVEQGTHGTCRRCAGAIAAGRLEALPTATTCITCASERPGRRRGR